MAKKQKVGKEEKKEAKLRKKAEGNTLEAIETKKTVIKSVTAAVCAAAVCISANSAVGSYSDAIIAAANAKANPTSASTGEADSTEAEYIYDASFENTDSETVPEEAASVDGSIAAEDTADNTQADESAADVKTEKSENSNDPTKFNKAQVVNYYNTCLKNTYNLPKLTISKTEDIKIVIDDITPGGDGMVKFGNKVINKYAKATDYTDTFANGKSTSGGDDAQEFSMHANLDPAGAKTATVTKKGDGYEINIAVASEKASLEKRPVYNSQCSNPLDLGAIDLFGLKITQADFNYPGTTLKAVVDSKGRVTSAVTYMPMNGSGAGKLIISGGATVHGSMTKSAKFSF